MGGKDLTFAKVLMLVTRREKGTEWGMGYIYVYIYIYLIINIKLFPIVERVDHFRHFRFIRREIPCAQHQRFS